MLLVTVQDLGWTDRGAAWHGVWYFGLSQSIIMFEGNPIRPEQGTAMGEFSASLYLTMGIIMHAKMKLT